MSFKKTHNLSKDEVIKILNNHNEQRVVMVDKHGEEDEQDVDEAVEEIENHGRNSTYHIGNCKQLTIYRD